MLSRMRSRLPLSNTWSSSQYTAFLCAQDWRYQDQKYHPGCSYAPKFMPVAKQAFNKPPENTHESENGRTESGKGRPSCSTSDAFPESYAQCSHYGNNHGKEGIFALRIYAGL